MPSHELFTIPVTQPVAVVGLATLAFLLAPLLFARLRLPQTVALIAAGVLLGPHGLGLLERDRTIELLGTVGLLYLMFIAATEIDLHDFSRHRTRSIVFGVLGFVLPLGFGTVLGVAFGYSIAAAVLLGAMLSSHTLLAYPVASRLGIAKNQAVMVAVGATIITDLLALLALAVISGAARGELTPAFGVRLTVSLVLFAAIILLGLPRLARFLFSRTDDGTTEYLFVLAALLGSAVLAEAAGVEPIIGAFLAGLALNPFLPEDQPLSSRLTFVADAVFVPFFLLSVGMLVDLRVLVATWRGALIALGMLAAVLPAKWLAAWVTRRRFGYTAAESWTKFGLSVPQAAATLAVALIGFETKLFDAAILNATIALIVVTCTLGPWIVERYGRQVALAEEQDSGRVPAEAPRVLIPIEHADTAERLTELGLLVRAPGVKDPILPLAVVRGGPRQAAAGVAAAEKLLRGAVLRAAAAGVPVVPLTRVDRSFAAGVIRGMTESRSTSVVTGWDGRRARRTGVLNDELDELVARTLELVVVARLITAINTTERMVALLPHAAHRGPGFRSGIRVLKLVASRLGARLDLITVGGDAGALEQVTGALTPRVPGDVTRVPDWETAMRAAAEGAQNDLVVLVSERRGRVAWERELDQMPRRLAGLDRNFCIVYPCLASAAQETRSELPEVIEEALDGGRVVTSMPEMTLGQALHLMLSTGLPSASPVLERAERALHAAAGQAAELLPGVWFVHARVEGVTRPTLFLGTSAGGVGAGDLSRPARVLAAVVSGLEGSGFAAHLAMVAPLLSDADRIERLVGCGSPECVASALRTPTPLAA